ncbi:hypothetical protein V5F32_21070, partial [Xanthobacter oligotrophicus]
MAASFHEAWKPAAYDLELHKRLDNSYAAHTFIAIRAALRREMILALMRLWDGRNDNLRMESIARALQDKNILDELSITATPLGLLRKDMRAQIGSRALEAADMINQYSKGGAKNHIIIDIKKLRHEVLAHRNMGSNRLTGPNSTDEEIDLFYNDNAKIIQIIMSVALATAFNPLESCGVFKHYASFFWAGVRGERVEGHPQFRQKQEGQ